jgi:hypothetical protein
VDSTFMDVQELLERESGNQGGGAAQQSSGGT